MWLNPLFQMSGCVESKNNPLFQISGCVESEKLCQEVEDIIKEGKVE